MALAISALLAALKAENGQDYVYACFFLISVRPCMGPLPCLFPPSMADIAQVPS